MPKKWGFTLEDLKKSKVAALNAHLFSVSENVKKSKYNNTKTEVDGILFDSAKEATRYKELRLLMKTGVIGLLKRQVEYELNEGGSYSLKYIADFEYILHSTGEKVTEDVKGFKTKEYLKKKRLMKKVHGILIKET
jgi:hypothetical protein